VKYLRDFGLGLTSAMEGKERGQLSATEPAIVWFAFQRWLDRACALFCVDELLEKGYGPCVKRFTRACESRYT
jgi:hypothetical protein